jgi:hypothetical protein
MEMRQAESARGNLAVRDDGEASPRPGRLLLVGCSEMFKDAYLHTPGFQPDQLLLNTVALFAHGEEFAEVEARRRVEKRFPVQPAAVKVRWRILAVGLGPAFFLAFGVFWWRVRRRPILGGRR